jgi:hypothetical protein
LVYEATKAAGETYHNTAPLFPQRAIFQSDVVGVLALNTPEVLGKIERNLLEKGFKPQPGVPQTADRKSLMFSNVAVELRNKEQLGKTIGRIGNEGYYIVSLAQSIKHLLRQNGIGVSEYYGHTPKTEGLVLKWDQIGSYRRPHEGPLGGTISHAVIVADPEPLGQIEQVLIKNGFQPDPDTVSTPEHRALIAPENLNAGQHRVVLYTTAEAEQDSTLKNRITYG